MTKLVISCIRGGRDGQRWEFDQDRVTIGRKRQNDLQLDATNDRKASGNHAELRREPHGFFLVDLMSTNGTFVNERRVQGEVELSDGDQVEFGKDGPILHFRMIGAHEAAPEPKTVLADLPGVPVIQAPPRVMGVPATPGPKTPMLPEPVVKVPRVPLPVDTGEVEIPVASGRTGIYRAMMQETVRKSSIKLKIMIAVLTVLLLGITIGSVFYFLHQRDETEKLQRQTRRADEQRGALETKTEALQTKLNETGRNLDGTRTNLASASSRLADLRLEMQEAEGAAKTRLEAQAAELERTKTQYEATLADQEKKLAALKRTEQAAEVIAEKYERSLFMLIAKTNDRLVGYCTAFAISPDGLLATNAHCVRNMDKMKAQGIVSLARMNRNADKTYQIVKWRSHSDYKNSAFSSDVALVQLDLKGDRLPISVELASDDDVHRLAPGRPVYTMGFPGRVMNEARPAADFRAAVISRLTTYDNTPGTPETARMVWHSALTSKGTSGSPIFNADGKVIAVNNGGLSARRVYTTDAVTGRLKEGFAYDATGLNFGIRVDALREVSI